MQNLKNKTVLITGGARGIGKQIALEFAKQSANIIICDLDESFFDENNFKSNIQDIKNLGVSCWGYNLDITKYDDIVITRDKILSDIGKIDILVNNAGVVFGGKFLDIPINQHQLTYNVNTQGTVNMLHIFLQDLIDQKESHIINIASASGFTALPNGTTYASSKAAVSSLSESLRLELMQNGNNHVGITIVSPAYVNTGMFDGVKEPTFIPMLTAEKLAIKIVQAVRKKKLFVLEPTFIKFIPFIKAIFPRFIYDFLGNILGGYNSMDLWKGHSNNKNQGE